MGKGRKFAPCDETDGNWYKSTPPNDIITDKNSSPAASLFPAIFEKNTQESCRQNVFSIHDNRHSLQDKGEYFGNGLGKLIDQNRSQHVSNNLQRKRLTEEPFDSNYHKSFTQKQAMPCTYRRFPRKYDAPNIEKSNLTTSTTKWRQPNEALYTTKLQVLALTQEPHTKPTEWKYSYRPSIFSWIATRRGTIEYTK